ncbi:serine protease [Thiospirochaeta perfilievii]|uniref:Serine protease n=1 Tax=Thiospirochaeta perfilievii TaxID=252967 RepID=A0A5C1QFY4_9SPIO|nr:serine protease [Thiospirochaeta perfilievii]QEN05989.1 serine protease [Thiospirochaeta perfilievii]
MKFKNRIKFVVIAITISFLGCVSPKDGQNRTLSNRKREIVLNSTFEVLIKKPVKDNLTYERDLPWDNISYNIRNDEYYSIGTAFSVSDKELLSAFHVIQLGEDSLVYRNYYIRDNKGNVYEVDNVTSFNKSKDFIKFTVKDYTFDYWLQLEDTYTINTTVFSVGNAYGEGIIIRDGNLIGTIPESENGQWVFLKSSSDVNSGNSGGPLLNSNGKVIGIVSSKKDNIAYSIPINEVISQEPNKGFFHYNLRYGFSLFPERLKAEYFDFSFDLPMNYQRIIKETKEIVNREYKLKMDMLFEENRGETFPNGNSSLEALIGNTYSFMPQVIFKDQTSKVWTISGIENKSENLRGEGSLSYSSLFDESFIINIDKPDKISLGELVSDSSKVMDLVLEGINVPRKFAGEDIRILSYGKPMESRFIMDDYGRKWKRSIWLIDFSDEVLISYTLPTPKGVYGIVTSSRSSNLHDLAYDYDKMLNFVEISYYGTFEEWSEFLSLSDLIPNRFKDISIYKNNDGKVVLDSSIFSVNDYQDIFENNSKLEITLDFDIFKKSEKNIWDIRRVVFAEENRDNFFVLYNNLKPQAAMRKAYKESWEDFLTVSHPFNSSPFIEDSSAKIGKLLNFDIGEEAPDEIFSIFLSKEGKVEDDLMAKYLDSINISLK